MLKQLFQVVFEAHESEETYRLVELHENVYVAVGPRFIAGDRAKERKGLDTKSPELALTR